MLVALLLIAYASAGFMWVVLPVPMIVVWLFRLRFKQLNGNEKSAVLFSLPSVVGLVSPIPFLIAHWAVNVHLHSLPAEEVTMDAFGYMSFCFWCIVYVGTTTASLFMVGYLLNLWDVSRNRVMPVCITINLAWLILCLLIYLAAYFGSQVHNFV